MIIDIIFGLAFVLLLLFVACVLIKVVTDLFFIVWFYYCEINIHKKIKHTRLFYSDDDFILEIKANRYKRKREYIASLYVN
jgi:hypothetical protein